MRGIKDERALVAAWQAGDQDALAELYRRHAPGLRTLCSRHLPAEAEVEVDDIVHEAFLRAQRAIDSFDPGAPVWPWLATIARRLCTDERRRRERRRRLEPPRPEPPVDLDEAVSARLRRSILTAAIARLSPSHRSAVGLHHLLDWSYVDIARLQGRSLTAVRSELVRARRKLRRQVRDVARDRGQWPLPTAAPLGRRLRHALDHARSSAQAYLAMVDLGSLLHSTGLAVLLAVALGTAFDGGGREPSLTRTLPHPSDPHGAPGVAAPHATAATRQRTPTARPDDPSRPSWEATLPLDVPTPTPVVKDDPRIDVEDHQDYITYEVWTDLDTPVSDDYGLGVQGNVACNNAAKQAACNGIRTVIPYLPPGAPIR